MTELRSALLRFAHRYQNIAHFAGSADVAQQLLVQPQALEEVENVFDVFAESAL